MQAPPAATAAPRTVVVTGASSGIGRATALAFARRGDHVVLVGRRLAALEETLAACGGRGRTQVCDVASREQVRALAASVREQEGRCDVLVNNAGIGARTPFDGPAAVDRLEVVLATNLVGPAACTAELLDLLRASAPSAVVNVSSIAGFVGFPGSPIYCASKFGLTGWSEAMYAALAGDGIHVATIYPGPAPTPGFPHAALTRRPWARPLLTSAEAVAAAIVDTASRNGSPSRTLPRLYGAVRVLQVAAPPLYRALLRRMARRPVEPLSGEHAA